MTSRRFSAWQKVVAFAPLMLLAVSLPGEGLLRCRMDGLLRSSCCCPADKGTPSSGPVLKNEGCCDREVTAKEPAAVEPVRQASADFAGAPLVALVAPLVLAADDAGRAPSAPHAYGPPRHGPSIVLLKHAFLI